jgi:UPF0716 protein FxsA
VFYRLILLFILLPFVELTLMLLLGKVTEWWVPIVFIVATGFLGSWLARTQGVMVYRRIQSEVAAGRMPTDAMIDGVMIFVAGLLLVSPGVLTDVLGISAMIPPVRAFYRRQLVAWFHRTFKISTLVAGERVQRSEVIDSYVVDKDSPPG